MQLSARYYKIADIIIEVRSEFPITEATFHPKFKSFETDHTVGDKAVVHHHFSGKKELKIPTENRVYFRPPWAIYHGEEEWVYQWVRPMPPHAPCSRTVIANMDHTYIDIYNDKSIEKKFSAGRVTSLTLLPTDQIFLGRLLAHKNGCILHSVGMILDGKGYLFVGHSDAGKTTLADMMKQDAVILCDDRNIVRKIGNTFHLFGTWSHGDFQTVSSRCAPLAAIFFLEQSDANRLDDIQDEHAVFTHLLSCLVRPLETREWWDASLTLLFEISQKIPCYTLAFDKSGRVVDVIKAFQIQPLPHAAGYPQSCKSGRASEARHQDWG